MTPGLFRMAAILGLLSCVGPFSIDMYLPALPSIERALETNVAAAQTTLAVYFAAFGVAQLVYGPLSDQIGRKAPLYIGLTVFILGAAGCAVAPSIGWLTASRFVQGLGGAAVMVIPRAIIRDQHTGTAATRLMALVMLVISVSPMLAPLAGSAIITFANWRGVFVALGIAGLASLTLAATALPETLPLERRVPINARTLARNARTLVADPIFMGLTFIGGFGMASFFVFIASAAFVYTGQFGLSPTEFSLAFAVNAIGFFAASQFAATFGERFGPAAVVVWAVTGFVSFATLLLVLVASGFGTLPVIIACLFCGNACLGLVIPTTMVMALDRHGSIAGLASSLGGTLQMLAGGAMIGLSGLFFDGTALPMVGAIAVCAGISFTLSRIVLARLRPVRTPAE